MQLICPVCSNNATFAFDSKYYKVASCSNVRCGHLFAISPPPSSGEKNIFPKHLELRDERLVSYLISRNFFNQYSRILDIGSGPGYLTKAVREILGSVYITCIEPSVSSREFLHSQGFSVYSDIDQVVREKFYTSVILKEVIEHIANPLETLKKVKTLLSDAGEIFISTPCGDFFQSCPNKHKLYTYNDPYHIHFFTERSLEHCLKEAGFSNITYCYVDSFYPNEDNSLTAINQRTKDAYVKFLRGEQIHLTYFAS